MTDDWDLATLLKQMERRIKKIFVRYQIPSEEFDTILQEAVLSLLYRRTGIKDPQAWLEATLRNRSLMYWRTRRSRLFDSTDQSVLEMVRHSVDAPPMLRVEKAEVQCDRANKSKDLARKSTQIPWIRAVGLFSIVELLLPARISNEELGDALEAIRQLVCRSQPQWKIYLKIATTVFWIGLNAVREITGAVLGKRKT